MISCGERQPLVGAKPSESSTHGINSAPHYLEADIAQGSNYLLLIILGSCHTRGAEQGTASTDPGLWKHENIKMQGEEKHLKLLLHFQTCDERS